MNLPTHSIQLLLANVIDYAGLFPPAKLDMSTAAKNYAAYRTDERAWALGKFIVPVSRLDEFEAAAKEPLARSNGLPWQLSVLAGPDVASDLEKILDFNAKHDVQTDRGQSRIDAVELKLSNGDEIHRIKKILPAGLETYCEIPADSDASLINTLAEVGARCKVRTGGVNPEAFPESSNLARFIRRCADAEVPFKATAGLHHPIRSTYHLTYEKNSPTGTMYGFLNVLLAAALVRLQVDQNDVVRLLEEESADAFRFDGEGVSWRAYRFSLYEILQSRTSLMISFGSCSFNEPIEDLKKIGLL